jgi:hypothetical protein
MALKIETIKVISLLKALPINLKITIKSTSSEGWCSGKFLFIIMIGVS